MAAILRTRRLLLQVAPIEMAMGVLRRLQSSSRQERLMASVGPGWVQVLRPVHLQGQGVEFPPLFGLNAYCVVEIVVMSTAAVDRAVRARP